MTEPLIGRPSFLGKLFGPKPVGPQRPQGQSMVRKLFGGSSSRPTVTKSKSDIKKEHADLKDEIDGKILSVLKHFKREAGAIVHYPDKDLCGEPRGHELYESDYEAHYSVRVAANIESYDAHDVTLNKLKAWRAAGGLDKLEVRFQYTMLAVVYGGKHRMKLEKYVPRLPALRFRCTFKELELLTHVLYKERSGTNVEVPKRNSSGRLDALLNKVRAYQHEAGSAVGAAYRDYLRHGQDPQQVPCMTKRFMKMASASVNNKPRAA